MKDSPVTDHASRITGTDRPAAFDHPQAERRPDCLLALLFDLIHVEIHRLPRVALHDWFRTAGLLLDLLPTEEKRHVWGELVAEHIVRQFPAFHGGLAACRQQIGCMRNCGRHWWESWRQEHAPPAAPAPAASSGPSEHEATP
ncbi:MAG: hypothetical protein ACREIB_05840 [Pseudomonadota bacterium]